MAKKRNRVPGEAQDAMQRETKKFKKEKPKNKKPKKQWLKIEGQQKELPKTVERKYATAVDLEMSDEDVVSDRELNDNLTRTRDLGLKLDWQSTRETNVGLTEYMYWMDSFAEHFEKEISDDLAKKLLADEKAKAATLWSSSDVMLPHLGKAEFFQPKDSFEALPSFDESDLNKCHVKKSLVDQLTTINEWKPSQSGDSPCQLSRLQLELFTIMNSYKDLYFPRRNHKNGEEIRLAYCLHALNHVLKTRNRVIRHNKKIENKKDEITDELRDQGLTRPKVLIVLPFRDSALKVVHMMMKLLSNREYTVASKHRFESEFGSEVDTKKGLKPEDYEVTFDGNIDDQFRIGISVSKKAIKLYEEFYTSDIILASPLGLWTIIGAQNEKERDFEFLSSIEVLIFDQMDVFFMQNFDHVMHVLSHLHHVPKEMHGVDYFRVRMWALNGWSKVYRQTLMFGSVTHPMIETIFRRHCVNYSGKLKLLNLPSSGTIDDIHSIHPLVQIFQRVNVSSLQECPDSRFNFFVKQILPHYVDGMVAAQALIFVSSYFDFVRLRNYLVKQEQNGNGATVALLSEYSKKSGISKSRQFFLEGKVRFLLFSERFHFFRRYKIRGIQHLIFYDLPIYPHFYPEICNMIEDSKGSAVDKYNQMCTVLFTKYDADRLVPVVGYEKTCELLSAEKNVHTFHSH